VAKYTEASTLKPGEKYPKDQLAAVAAKRDEAAKKAEEERKARELQEKYQAAIAAGDAAFKGNQLDAAVAKFNEALELKPQEKYPKDQLAAIEKKRQELASKEEEERRQRELNERYNALITTADAAFNGQQWEEARAKYTEASSVKSSEKYPKDQLAAIDKKVAELAKKAEEEQKARELEQRYQGIIAAADAAFNTADWSAATAKYTEASAVKPQEKYPKDQLALVQKRIAEAEEQRKQQELNARYQAAVDAADQQFSSGELAAARKKYEEASGIKPAESHPKQRISEIDATLAAQAKAAEEERKRQELEARYTALIASADKSYTGENWSAALNDYKDALQLKPDAGHPKERIAAIEKQLDAAAQARAEEERLKRDAQEREKRYQDLIKLADKAFAASDLDKAATEYTAALEVKPGEAHPTTRLADIERLRQEARARSEADRLAAERDAEERARKAEADRLAAERDAEERARKAEADRLAAERDAAERARLAEADRLAAEERARREEEERMRRDADSDTQARYNAFVAAADRAFSGNEYDLARKKYQDALGVLPNAQHPKDRLAAIEDALARKSSEDELRRQREREAEEAARLAAEQERLAREQDAEAARRRAEEEERQRREGERAAAERYASTIADADKALAAKSYEEARNLFAMASDIRPQEPYPLSKIDQIDKLLAEMERQRLEAELAAERARQNATERPRNTTTIDTRKEQEAEQFMRAAREQEEAEKYARIVKFRSDLALEEEAKAEQAGNRRNEGVQLRERHLEQGAGFYSGDEERRRRNAREMEELRELYAQAEAERAAKAARSRLENAERNQAVLEEKQALDQEWERRHAEQSQEMVRFQQDVLASENERVDRSADRTAAARAQAEAVAQANSDMRLRGDAQVSERQQQIESEKQALAVREAQLRNTSEQSRQHSREALENIPRDQPRAFADYHRSKLATEYQQGVTEESYTEGNKVIIRRVVVRGNKADEYSKVIAKWGTFYFKNGQSITEAIWSRETEG
jgi:hypothetical protein